MRLFLFSLCSSDECKFKGLNVTVVIIIILPHTYVKVRVNLDSMGKGEWGQVVPVSHKHTARTQLYIVACQPTCCCRTLGGYRHPAFCSQDWKWRHENRYLVTDTSQQSTCHAGVRQKGNPSHTRTHGGFALLLSQWHNPHGGGKEGGVASHATVTATLGTTWIQPRTLNRLEM